MRTARANEDGVSLASPRVGVVVVAGQRRRRQALRGLVAAALVGAVGFAI